MSNWFKEFDNRTVISKDQIPWAITVEYEIQSHYFVSNLNSLPELDKATDLELISAAQSCNNLIRWIEQMKIMGYTGLPVVMEDLLQNEFGNRKQLFVLRQAYIDKWLHGKSGQHKLGENHFTVDKGKFYYRTLQREWYEVDPSSVFEIMPTLNNRVDAHASEKLDDNYVPTRYQQIYASWRDAKFTGHLITTNPKSGQSTPEEILKDTVSKLEVIIKEPPALTEVERAIVDKPNYLEYLIKLSCLIADFAHQRRASNEYTLYLLRDCAMFHEAQILIDMIKGEHTSHDQVYLGRQSLSSEKRDAGHWYTCQELLLLSLQKNPKDFDSFSDDFTKSLKDYEAYSEDFAELVQKLAQYLNNHIEEAKRKKLPINVIDLGFQGSINMIVKYVLDQYCKTESGQTNVHMYVVAPWFNNVYRNMYSSDTFSALTHIEVMARNNAIYEYVPRSLRDGKLDVVYGSEDAQEQASMELTVMSTAIILDKNSNPDIIT